MKSLNSSTVCGTWKSYTPTIGATTTAPTVATTKTLKGLYKVIGKTLFLNFTYYAASNTGAVIGSGVYTFSLPTGYTINTSLASLPSTIGTASYAGADGSTLGFGTAGATSYGQCVVVPLSTTTVGLYLTISSDSATSNVLIGSTALAITTANRSYKFTAEIPIV